MIHKKRKRIGQRVESPLKIFVSHQVEGWDVDGSKLH
jgi:hypothetical protein